MRTIRLALISTIFFAFATTRGGVAGMVNFTFAGTDMTGGSTYGTPTSGSGSFTFADGLTSLSVNDLTSFNFSDTTNYRTYGSVTFKYTLADVFYFSATLTSSRSLTSLSLATNATTSNNGAYLYQTESFVVKDLAPDDAYSRVGNTYLGVLVGTITPAATPEPTSIVLCGLGLAGAFLAGRRRAVAG